MTSSANEGTQIHHRVLKVSWVCWGDEACRRFPQSPPAGRTIDRILKIEQARENAAGIRFDERQRSIKSEHGDSIGSVTADSGQRLQCFGLRREGAFVLFSDDSGTTMKIACPGIVAQPLPGVENVAFPGLGESLNGRETPEPSNIVRDHGGGLSLLEHNFGEEDGVGIAGVAPR